MTLLFETYLFLALLMLSYMSAWFVVSLMMKRSDVADIAWGLGFFLVAIVTAVGGGADFDRRLLVTIFVFVWAFRLSTHIFFRNRGKGEDRRYVAWRESWGAWFPLRASGELKNLLSAIHSKIFTMRCAGAMGIFG